MQFRWENQSDHSLGKWYAKFRTVKFCPGVSFAICTNQFHLTKKRPRGNETDGFVQMELHEFPFGILCPGKQENLFRCSAITTKKVMFQPLCIKRGALARSGAPRVRKLGYHYIREILVVTSSHVTFRPYHRHTLFPCSPVPLSPFSPVPRSLVPLFPCSPFPCSLVSSFLYCSIPLFPSTQFSLFQRLSGGCLQFRWENQSDHSLGKWYAKFRTVKFCPGVSFAICTNQFHLTKKRPRGNETDGFVQMELHEFPFGILCPGKQENLFRCSAITTKKVMFQPLCIKRGALARSGAPRVRKLGYHYIREILVVTSSHVTFRPYHRHTLFPCSPVPLSPFSPVPRSLVPLFPCSPFPCSLVSSFLYCSIPLFPSTQFPLFQIQLEVFLAGNRLATRIV